MKSTPERATPRKHSLNVSTFSIFFKRGVALPNEVQWLAISSTYLNWSKTKSKSPIIYPGNLNKPNENHIEFAHTFPRGLPPYLFYNI